MKKKIAQYQDAECPECHNIMNYGGKFNGKEHYICTGPVRHSWLEKKAEGV